MHLLCYDVLFALPAGKALDDFEAFLVDSFTIGAVIVGHNLVGADVLAFYKLVYKLASWRDRELISLFFAPPGALFVVVVVWMRKPSELESPLTLVARRDPRCLCTL